MTLAYNPPLKEIRFILDLLKTESSLQKLPPFADVDTDLMMQIITEAGRFARDVLFPLNQVGDRHGAHFHEGKVTTPPGFADAYKQFQEAGWPSLHCDPAYGGQGLPQALNIIVYELLSAANHAWTMYPGLQHGAYECLRQYGSDSLKSVYLPKLVSGEWLATMCLTEPQAGSDLGLLRTKAQPDDNGMFKITGTKIFISGGEQDLSENIVHLVLARLPDAPAGSRGISLFLVPKYLGEDSSSFQENAVYCTGIEEKLGIHGSATCSMAFEEAKGWLVGKANQGLASMFVMMNSARIMVGVQGIGCSEVVWQNALQYAHEREQMRAPARSATRQSEPADPIVMHPAVQRLLMDQKAYLDAGRMLTYWAALHLDNHEHHPDSQEQEKSGQLLALITPVIKAAASDHGFRSASDAVQIYGGHGFITETGIEQYLRDSRITKIYEGTNEIQAIDLLLRKILADNGTALKLWFDHIKIDLDQAATEFNQYVHEVFNLCKQIAHYTKGIGQLAGSDLQLPYRLAPEILHLVSHAAFGWLWIRAATMASQQDKSDKEFYQGKINTAHYYFTFLFPEIQKHQKVIETCLAASSKGQGSVFFSYDRF